MVDWHKGIISGYRCETVDLIREHCLCYNDIFDTAILFGSTARDDYHSDSDIDILVLSNRLTSMKLLRCRRFNDFVEGLYDLVEDKIEFDIVSFGRNELKNFKRSQLYRNVLFDGVKFYDIGLNLAGVE